jgi:arginyl-tRNA synthetase
MIRHDIATLVADAADRARKDGSLPDVALPEIVIERPQRAEHGDYATNQPLQPARAAKANPIELAKQLAAKIVASEAIDRIEVAPPGFVNFHLSETWLAKQVDAINKSGSDFARAPVGNGQKVQVEFVSANPTGPLHAGNGRWAAMGSTLVRVLRAADYAVEAEYYFNDAGTQIETFGRTLYARYQQLFGRDEPIPDDGYIGSYMVELAEQAKAEFGDEHLASPGQPAPAELTRWGIEHVMEWIKRDLTDLGVHYDVWYREQTVYEAGYYDKVMALLKDKGLIVEREGAVWLAATQLEADKDEVLIRSSGVPTYLATDIGYHYDKFIERGFDQVIDIWGADHQGHVSRVKTAVGALGVPEGGLEILIGQLVGLRRGNEVVRMSKRAGETVSLREVVDEVGADACRFFFLQRSADAQMEFDLDLANRKTNETAQKV